MPRPPCLRGPLMAEASLRAGLGSCIRKRIPQGRFPTRPRFFLGVGVRAVSLCALGSGGWGGYHGNMAWNTHLPNIQPQRT